MASFFSQIKLQPPNGVLGLALDCSLDQDPNKIDLIIGAYRDDNGNPKVLDCVREAEGYVYEQNPGHEYLKQDGLEGFDLVTKKLLLGDDSSLVKEGKVFTIQTLSGTGALRLSLDFLYTFMAINPVDNQPTIVYYPSTTWANHPAIIEVSHFMGQTYRYLDETGCQLDFDGLCTDLSNAVENSVFLFHMCGHNPTGVDPTEEQWKIIYSICRERKCIPMFDNAYQGYVSGDPDKDAFAVRYFAEEAERTNEPLSMLVCCSFAKNFGLYGERVGALHVVTNSAEEIKRVGSQLRALSRIAYSTCPAYGARLVHYILSDPERKRKWKLECKGLADRINSIRRTLYDKLLAYNVKGTWEHVIEQRGMFSYTGVSPEAVLQMRRDYHIYMLESGRISIAGLNSHNVDRFVQALVTVLGTN